MLITGQEQRFESSVVAEFVFWEWRRECIANIGLWGNDSMYHPASYAGYYFCLVLFSFFLAPLLSFLISPDIPLVVVCHQWDASIRWSINAFHQSLYQFLDLCCSSHGMTLLSLSLTFAFLSPSLISVSDISWLATSSVTVSTISIISEVFMLRSTSSVHLSHVSSESEAHCITIMPCISHNPNSFLAISRGFMLFLCPCMVIDYFATCWATRENVYICPRATWAVWIEFFLQLCLALVIIPIPSSPFSEDLWNDVVPWSLYGIQTLLNRPAGSVVAEFAQDSMFSRLVLANLILPAMAFINLYFHTVYNTTHSASVCESTVCSNTEFPPVSAWLSDSSFHSSIPPSTDALPWLCT